MIQIFRLRCRSVLLAALALLLFSAATSAQVTTATITGRVVDPQGAVVPGAKVTATNRGTGAERTAVTNSDGEYTIPSLAPGRYNIAVEAQSFSRSLVEDTELNVGSRPTFNFELRAGSVTETVTVTGEQPLVETTRSEIGQTVTPQEIQNLPLLNRTFAGLSVIAPEARPVGTFDPTKTRVGTVAFNGGDGRQVNVNVDGGDNKDNVVGSLLQNFSYESIQEFQIQQHRWAADQGRAVGGVVNVVTKSGTNNLRGSFFSNFRDDALQVRDFIDKQNNRDNGEFQRQEIGGSIGGPIIKDRLFYFFALEHFRERQNLVIGTTDAANLQLIPGVQFVPEIPTPYDDTLLTAKTDARLNDKQSLSFRFSYQGNESPNDQVANPPRTDLSGGNQTTNKLYSFVGNHTYNISPNVLNQFTFHFQDFKNEILPNAEGLTLNFPGSITIGQNANTPQATEERKFQFRNDTTWLTGDHTFKFGTNWIHTKLDGYFYFGTRGYNLTFRFTPQEIMAVPGGFNRDDLLQSLTYSDGAASHKQTIDQLAFYIQDDWKITRKLTLNLGLRWDANIGNLFAQDQNRTIQILDTINHPLANALTSDPDKLRRTTPSWKEFQPRLGFAYDPQGDGKTVIRGGYGIFYDQLFQNLTLFSASQSEPTIFQAAISLTRPTGAPVPTSPLYGIRLGGPLPQPPAGFNFANLANGAVGRINDPDASEPYIQKFSIGFQRELTANMSLSSDYVHQIGLNEPRFLNINPLISSVCNASFGGNPNNTTLCPGGASTRLLGPAFVAAGLPHNRIGQINMFTTTNRSLFDSWTTTLKYRTGKHILNASYVLSSSRAWGGQPTASYSGNGIAITRERQFATGEFGPTRMDERHRIVLSGVFNLPWDFSVSPILQYATARPFSPVLGFDVDGDGLSTIDRLCQGVDPLALLNAIRNRPTGVTAEDVARQFNPIGCQQVPVNNLRSGYVLEGNQYVERDGRFFNVDLRVTKNWKFGERFGLATYVDLYNVFNTENLSFASRIGLSGPASNAAQFMQVLSLFGPGFGPPVGRPFTAQLGARFTF
jgi:hypothetical protein